MANQDKATIATTLCTHILSDILSGGVAMFKSATQNLDMTKLAADDFPAAIVVLRADEDDYAMTNTLNLRCNCEVEIITKTSAANLYALEQAITDLIAKNPMLWSTCTLASTVSGEPMVWEQQDNIYRSLRRFTILYRRDAF